MTIVQDKIWGANNDHAFYLRWSSVSHLNFWLLSGRCKFLSGATSDEKYGEMDSNRYTSCFQASQQVHEIIAIGIAFGGSSRKPREWRLRPFFSPYDIDGIYRSAALRKLKAIKNTFAAKHGGLHRMFPIQTSGTCLWLQKHQGSRLRLLRLGCTCFRPHLYLYFPLAAPVVPLCGHLTGDKSTRIQEPTMDTLNVYEYLNIFQEPDSWAFSKRREHTVLVGVFLVRMHPVDVVTVSYVILFLKSPAVSDTNSNIRFRTISGKETAEKFTTRRQHGTQYDAISDEEVHPARCRHAKRQGTLHPNLKPKAHKCASLRGSRWTPRLPCTPNIPGKFVPQHESCACRGRANVPDHHLDGRFGAAYRSHI